MHNIKEPISIYNKNSSFLSQITYLRYYELIYNKITGINEKLDYILSVLPETNPLQYYIDDSILFIRNIHHGRGERDLTYSLLYTIQQYSIDRVIYLLNCMVYYNFQTSSIGCWKDIRGYAEFIYKYMNKNDSIPIIKTILRLYVKQLIIDRDVYENAIRVEYNYPIKKYITFAAKYAPREKTNSKTYYLYELLFESWCELDMESINILYTAKGTNKYDSAIDKCKMLLRKTISKLNKSLETLEISMCNKSWDTIIPYQIPHSALIKNKSALIKHSQKLKNYIDEIDKMPNTYAGYEIVNFILNTTDPIEIEKWNNCWNQKMKKFQTPHNYYVPILDVYSLAYEGCNKYKICMAYAAAIILAEKSLFGKKILLTYLNKHYWVDITDCSLNIILERLQCVIDFTQTHNPSNALMVILGAAMSGEFTQEDVQKLQIVFISPTELSYESFTNYQQQWEMGGSQIINKPYILDGNNFEKKIF